MEQSKFEEEVGIARYAVYTQIEGKEDKPIYLGNSFDAAVHIYTKCVNQHADLFHTNMLDTHIIMRVYDAELNTNVEYYDSRDEL